MAKSQATLLKVVIASPGDVAEERDLVEKAVTEINRNSASDRGLRLDVYRWETDAYPGFHAEGPQGIVDDVLGIEGAWVLIGIFWSRFGTPIKKKGKTGTEHEIDKAIQGWKKNGQPQPMIFFRTEPPKLKSPADRLQWVKIAEYQQKVAGQKGLYWEYEKPADFERELRNTLQNYLRKNHPLPGERKSRAKAKPGRKTTAISTGSFLQTYRARHAHHFETYDTTNLGVRLAGAEQPQTVYLDDIYLTLRFGDGYNIRELEKGEPINPADLLKRDRHLLVRGPAGAGKTTWMKRTFRALLGEDALPIFVELRGLAKDWRDHGEHPLDDALVRCVAKECPAHGLLKAVKSGRGTRPILLIDGWDELGEMGRNLRQKLLGFLDEHRHVLAVVSSRPYGKDVPSENAGFEELDLQPLNDAEVGSFASSFHHLCYGEETEKASKKAEEFLEALRNSHGADDLARTPLLLTMMLGLSRTRPMPDKRHKLYEECVKALLAERPKRYQQEGVQFDDWFPPDEDERLLVVAALAYRLQDSSPEYWDGPLVADWEQMSSYLPNDWGTARKNDFLSWLAGPAALLNERSDNTLAFTHLSFQEFLAAWNRSRSAALQRGGHITFAAKKATTLRWWETLRLWAALVEGQQGRETLQPVLDNLLRTDEGLALAGAMLADGLGTEEFFHRWAREFAGRFRGQYFGESEIAARAWAASRQQGRRNELPRLWQPFAAKAGWIAWLRLQSWAATAEISGTLSTPRRETPAGRVIACLREGPESEHDFAVGRILCCGDPTWPGEPVALALLQVWPSHRRLAATRLQNVVAGHSSHLLQKLAPKVLAAPARSEESETNAADWARSWARSWARDLTTDLARDLAADLARDFAPYRVSYWSFYMARVLQRNWVRDGAGAVGLWGDVARDWARDWASHLTQELNQGWAWRLASGVARILGLDPSKPDIDFALWEVLSLGRSAARGRLSSLKPASAGRPLPAAVHLLRSASTRSFRPDSPLEEFDEELSAYKKAGATEPLWPALARHLTRRSTPADKALLEDLAQHPEKRDPPLSWGLRYIVRGDILMEEGTVVTIDELCDQHGLPRLPYLEDLPPELEVDWEGEEQPQSSQSAKGRGKPKGTAKPKARKKKPAKKKPSSARR